jgi:hypothetical protein
MATCVTAGKMTTGAVFSTHNRHGNARHYDHRKDDQEYLDPSGSIGR